MLTEDLQRRPLRWLYRLVLAAYLLLLAAGLVSFLSRSAPRRTAPIDGTSPHAGQEINLASMWVGGSVSVSSYDAFNRHHPSFAIDGRDQPTRLEKWLASADDASPWLAVRLPSPADVTSVTLDLVAAQEGRVQPTRWVRLTCDGSQPAQRVIPDNGEPRITVALSCPAATQVRVELRRQHRDEPVGLYEIAVLGEPVK